MIGIVATMNKKQVEIALNRAIDIFIKEDMFLLNADANERSMSHRIAVYLEHEIPDFDIDCEYNRDGFDVKRLALEPRNTSDDSEEAVTVFPDIIIHHRGNNNNNLLVIEMKKANTSADISYDLHKLRAFRQHLGYKWAVHLIIGYQQSGDFVRRLQWIDS